METDRNVLVTGAAGGIGSTIEQRFIANGDRVLATDTTTEALDGLRGQLEATEHLITAAADISSPENVRALAEVAREQTGSVRCSSTAPASSRSCPSSRPRWRTGAR